MGSSNHEKNDTEEEAPPAADGSSIMQPVVNEATTLMMPCCWICSKTDEDPSVLCHNCDSNGGHAHIKCIVNQARAKNETDYCNYKVDTTIMDDTKSLEKEYNSLKSSLKNHGLSVVAAVKIIVDLLKSYLRMSSLNITRTGGKGYQNLLRGVRCDNG